MIVANKLESKYHVNVITPWLIYCWSDAADYEYFIRFEEKATQEIIDWIEEELDYYGNPESAGSREMYYFNSGYVEVVTDMLDGHGIEYTVFTKMEN